MAGLRSTKVDVVSVELRIGSLNVALTPVVVLTAVAPLAGVTAVTVGGVGSDTTVVKDQRKLLAMGLPARSFTPPAPPMTVAL